MIRRKRSLLLCALLLLALVGVPLAAPAYAAPGPVSPTNAAADPPPQASHRLIVELDSAPLAVWQNSQVQLKSAGGAQVQAAAAQAYTARLQQAQATFVQTLKRVVPSASVSQFVNETGARENASYTRVFNGMALDPGSANRDQLRKQLLGMAGVKHVYLDYAHYTTLYSSTALINAPVLWNDAAIGGQANGGAGLKVASIDGGIHKDAPMFSGAGYSYPAGFPSAGLGLTANNNGKIIVSRAYFRPWDPPAPGDENPWPGTNGTEHGVHTAGIAAGNVVTATYANLSFPAMSGVAPRAWLMSYRVFYNSVNGDGVFYTTEGIAALEDMVADGADVVNNSWGGGPSSAGGEFDALDTALNNASQAGVFVALSAGNAGPGYGTADHPSSAYMVVGATTSAGTLASGRVSVTAPTPVPTALQNIAIGTASFGEAVPLGTVRTYPMLPALSVDPANESGCSAWPAGTFTGKAALISRNTCGFDVKVLNAQQAGATFVVIYNNAAGGNALITMGAGTVAAQVTIPSVFIGRTNGLALVDWSTQQGTAARLEFTTQPFQIGNTPDQVASFSSRGPGVGNTLKPDIAAPGVNILSQGFTPDATGEARHLGFGQASGTSMAAPHVAGAAALLRQAHPTWSNAYIKSALMSTAKYLEIYNSDGTPAQPLDMGAGRLDLTRAANPGVILSPPSLSFGLVPTDTVRTITVTLTSVVTQTETYQVSTLFTGQSFTQTTALPGFTVSPATITLPPGGTASLIVSFTPPTSQGMGDNQGYVVLDGAIYDAHLPAWARVTYATHKADVLILDNDMSALPPAFLPTGTLTTTDYLGYYTTTLSLLGYSYDVWDVDAHATSTASRLPDLATLLAYNRVLLFTGDNYIAVLTAADRDRLTEYVNTGRTLIAMGQDLAAALGAAATTSTVFFYTDILGAHWQQDSVSNSEQPNLPVLATATAPLAFKHLRLDLGSVGDGAHNQFYIDEFLAGLDKPDPTRPEESEPYVPLLWYPGANNLKDGVVAVAHRSQPSLEQPGIAYTGRTIYAAFGLEGVNNSVGATTRANLLGTFLKWAADEPQVSFTTTPVQSSDLTIFKVGFSSPISDTTALSYRWDFGDGSAFVASNKTGQNSHSYAVYGRYLARAEVTDSYGNRALTTQLLTTEAYGVRKQYMPMLFR